jgi:hypothetical protein
VRDLTAQAGRIPTVFGRLCFLSEQREDPRSGPDARERAYLHVRAFQDWLGLTLKQQSYDLTGYTSVDANRARFSGDRAGSSDGSRLPGFLIRKASSSRMD